MGDLRRHLRALCRHRRRSSRGRSDCLRDVSGDRRRRPGTRCNRGRNIEVARGVKVELAGPDEPPRAYSFLNAINNYFRYAGIGWQLVDGKIVTRGDDAFEHTIRTAEDELISAGRTTAAGRIKKAVQNLSARPQPDTSGAISHATGAMECVLHDITGQEMTLGDYVNRHRNLFPGSIQKALHGLWGFSSEEGARHGREGTEPSREDADFVVAISAAVTRVGFPTSMNPTDWASRSPLFLNSHSFYARRGLGVNCR